VPGRERGKPLLRPPWPLVLLAAAGFLLVYLLRAPTHEHLGPYLASLTEGGRAVFGAAAGAVVGGSVVLAALPPLRRRYPVPVLFYAACATAYWFAAAWPEHRRLRGRPLIEDSGRFFVDQADWYVVTSLLTFLVVAVAGLNVVYREEFRKARATHRRRRERAKAGLRRRGRETPERAARED
jgi:hypothetical protein